MLFESLFTLAAKRPNDVGVSDDKGQYTYQQLAAMAAGLGMYLGLQTQAAQMSRDAEAVVHENDIAARDSVSGVNLDEEAANMMRYQQAYAAAAQIIAISGELFDSLLTAVRR